MELDCYNQKLNVRFAEQVVEGLKTRGNEEISGKSRN